MTKTKEIACLCGAREDDHGQERPRKCWFAGIAPWGGLIEGEGDEWD